MRKLLHLPYSLPKTKWVDYLLHSFKVCCFVFFALVSMKSVAQTFPSPSSCTSGDLLLVNATLPSVPCETCTPGSTITKPLTLYINNKTGSTRTSFAFCATLVVRNSNGTIASSTSINKCFATIPSSSITAYSYGNLSYLCGQSLELINIWEAWTDASPKSTCPTIIPPNISPKCGIVASLNVIAGVDANFVVTDATCATTGSIKVKPFGGTGPYSVQLGSGTPRSVNAGDSTTFTGLGSGTYTFTLKDANNCNPGITKTRTVNAPSSIPTPTITSGAATCSAAGSSTISNYSASNTYTFTPSGPSVGAGGLISGMTVGTSYTVTSNNGSCTSTASAPFSNAANLANPTFTVCVVQPTLCSTGSVTVNATGGSGFLYTIDGTDPTPSNTSNVFSNLGVGSVTTIKVKNSEGCSATPVNCADIVSDCSAPLARSSSSVQVPEQQTTTVKAYPNPFSDKVKFVITSAQAGSGSLEVFNVMGQKVKTVYQGHVAAGVNNFELSLPNQKNSNLIYRFKMAGKPITGKLIQINK